MTFTNGSPGCYNGRNDLRMLPEPVWFPADFGGTYNMLRKLACVLFLLISILMCTVPVAASSYMEHEGLEVTVVTDKEQYDAGESITATITVTNTTGETVNVVNLEQLIPAGYALAADSAASMSEFELLPGETVVLEVTLEGQPVELQEGEGEQTSFVDKILYGETFGIPNLLLTVLALIAFGIFMLLT